MNQCLQPDFNLSLTLSSLSFSSSVSSISLLQRLHRRDENWQQLWWMTSSQLHFSISSLLQPSFLLLSPPALLILSMNNTASPGQAWTGGQPQRPDLETKLFVAFRCPPGPCSSRKSACCWARAVNKLLMRKQTSILWKHQDRWTHTTCLFSPSHWCDGRDRGPALIELFK